MVKLAVVVSIAALAVAPFAAADCPWKLNEEYPKPADEHDAFLKAQKVVNALQEEEHNSGESLRFFHAKAHGCAKGTFVVEQDIDDHFKHGVFATPGKSYNMVARFSNGQSAINPDKTPDTRGFAVQVLDVPGDRLLDNDHTEVVTFISAAFPSFPAPDAATIGDQMTVFAKTGVAGAAAKAAWLATHPKVAIAVVKMVKMGAGVLSPLAATYWSQTPYRIGPNNAIKFRFEPCIGQSVPDEGKSGDNYLREALNDALNGEHMEACFQMSMQKQEDPCEQPIEDAMKEWDTDFYPVAKLFIHNDQDLNSAQARYQCENSEYNPWHSTTDHRPLGINRFRKPIYEFSSGNRHGLNGAEVHRW